jgi:membrane protease YdiL (CAAX protease family)
MTKALPKPVVMRRPEILVLVATAALLTFYYVGRADTIGVFSGSRGWTAMTLTPLRSPLHYALSAVLLGAIPLLVALRLSGATLSQLGLGLGEWRRGLPLLAVGIPLAVFAGWIASREPAMRAVYPLDPSLARSNFPAYAALQMLYIGAWEMLFRGVLLFGLRGIWTEHGANAIQTSLSVVAHFGRAINETLSAFPAGFVFGWFSLRVGSIWYVAVVHWMVGISMEWFIIR